jgi:hypothetical protein
MPVLESPESTVVGAADVAAMTSFLGAFDFEETGTVQFPDAAARQLYGLERATHGIRLGVPGASSGGLQVIETPHAAHHRGPTDQGAHAIDLYTRDIEKSLRIAEAAGGRVSTISSYKVGPLTLREAKVEGPDHLELVFLEVDRRRSSRLDHLESALNSEVHSFVWIVSRIDDCLPFWRDEAGLISYLDVTMREPSIAEFMGLPRPDAPLRLAMTADAAGKSSRFELIEFPEDPGDVAPSWPLRGGLFAPAFRTANLVETTRLLPSARFTEPVEIVDGGKRVMAVSGVAPGGVRFEVRQG